MPEAAMAGADPRLLLRDVEEQARVDATLDVERRSIVTTVIIVVLAALFAWAAAQSTATKSVFELALAILTPLTLLRLLLLVRARRLSPGSPGRLLGAFGPLCLLIAAWAAFAAWGAHASQGTPLCTVIVATQCLCSAAVVVSYAGMPRLATAIIAVMIVPTAAVVLLGGGTDRMSGPGALLFGAMLVSYLPRVARERRAGVVAMLLLSARTRSLEEARDAALAAASAKETFSATLSHEIRTPLHGLLGTVERLKGMRLEDEQRAAVEQLHRCGQMLLCTLNDALDSIRLESGRLQLHPERMELAPLIREVIDTFGDEARRKGLAISLDLEVEGQVIGDAQRLRQVLQNLIGNAVKFTERGSVAVSARTSALAGGRVELAVDVLDSGVGFAAADRDNLFQRFTPLSARPGGGSGLGLSISAELARLMGGTIEASSAGTGCGARFLLRIPMLTVEGASVIVTGRRVLVVDDNPVNLTVATAYLKALGVEVDAVNGGDEALRHAAQSRYDAILMDCNMPGRDGYMTTRELRARGDHTPVLAITATVDDSTTERCTEAGIEAVVEKPITSDTLREALARVMSARKV